MSNSLTIFVGTAITSGLSLFVFPNICMLKVAIFVVCVSEVWFWSNDTYA
jgi:hypothetical protein